MLRMSGAPYPNACGSDGTPSTFTISVRPTSYPGCSRTRSTSAAVPFAPIDESFYRATICSASRLSTHRAASSAGLAPPTIAGSSDRAHATCDDSAVVVGRPPTGCVVSSSTRTTACGKFTARPRPTIVSSVPSAPVGTSLLGVTLYTIGGSYDVVADDRSDDCPRTRTTQRSTRPVPGAIRHRSSTCGFVIVQLRAVYSVPVGPYVTSSRKSCRCENCSPWMNTASPPSVDASFAPDPLKPVTTGRC